MRDTARTRAWLAVLCGCLLTVACNINPLPTPGDGAGVDVGPPLGGGDTTGGGNGGGGADAGAPGPDAAPSDTAAADDTTAPADVALPDGGGDAHPGDAADATPADGAGPADAGPDALAPDALAPDTLGPTDPRVAAPEPVCEPFDGLRGGRLLVTLTWTTAAPAVCAVAVALQDGAFWAHPAAVFTEPATAFSWEHWLYTYDGWSAPPAAGDPIAWRVDCRPPGDTPDPATVGAAVSWTLDEAAASCLWPFDRDCGDGSVLFCRAGPPDECPDEGMVLAVQDDCWRCVYAATCACDDGTQPVCPMPQPDCPAGAILAVQDGCWVCADPLRCTPLTF